MSARLFQSLLAVLRRHHLISGAGEVERNELDSIRLIVHHENLVLHSSERSSGTQFSAVPNITAFIKVDHLFSNIRGVIGNSFQALRNDHQVQTSRDRRRPFYDITDKFPVKLLIDGVY